VDKIHLKVTKKLQAPRFYFIDSGNRHLEAQE